CASYEADGFVGFSSVRADAPSGLDPFFDDEAGVRFAGNASRSLFVPRILRGNGGNGLRGNINFSAATFQGENDSQLTVFSPQIGPSFRVSAFGLFGEVGATGGAAIGELDSDVEDDNDFSYAYRPYGRVGVVGDTFLFGVEGGYEATGLDFAFSEAGDDYENWYAGFFVGFRLTK
ncbi:MAG: hypothetical protein AAGK78_06045, partial [Planctomycetota bacterium]